MDAKELERKINEKIGEGKNYKINEKLNLIRTLETDEIVLMDNESALNGHHLLKDATPEEIKRIADHFKFSDDEDMIPDIEPKGEPGGDDDLIPD